MDIKDKRIVVTGGASGIGKALAKAFLAEDARYVLIADLNEKNLEESKNELNCDAYKIDVSKEDEIVSSSVCVPFPAQ